MIVLRWKRNDKANEMLDLAMIKEYTFAKKRY